MRNPGACLFGVLHKARRKVKKQGGRQYTKSLHRDLWSGALEEQVCVCVFLGLGFRYTFLSL